MHNIQTHIMLLNYMVDVFVHRLMCFWPCEESPISARLRWLGTRCEVTCLINLDQGKEMIMKGSTLAGWHHFQSQHMADSVTKLWPLEFCKFRPSQTFTSFCRWKSRSRVSPFVERSFGWTCELPRLLRTCPKRAAETDFVACSAILLQDGDRNIRNHEDMSKHVKTYEDMWRHVRTPNAQYFWCQ